MYDELISREVIIIFHGGKCKGVVAGHSPNEVIVKDSNDEDTYYTIVKDKITAISYKKTEKDKEQFPTPEKIAREVTSKEERKSTLSIYACYNPELKCDGVKYIRKNVKKTARSIASEFISDCPYCRDTCKFSKGKNLFEAEDKLLEDMMDCMIFGEYPTPKKK